VKPDSEALTEAMGLLFMVLLDPCTTVPMRATIRRFLERETTRITGTEETKSP
jgi:hypothetical protein